MEKHHKIKTIKKHSFMFFIEHDDDYEEDGNESPKFRLYINPKRAWDEDKALADEYTHAESEILNIIEDDLELDGIMESTWLIPSKYNDNIVEFKKIMFELGFENNDDFNNFMIECSTN